MMSSSQSLFTLDQNSAAHKLLNNGIIVFPTDTVYGIGCLPESSDAYNRIYMAKNRPVQKRLSLYVRSVEDIQQWAEEPLYSDVISKFLPGCYTFIFRLNKRARAALPIEYFDDTIGIRIPDCPMLMALLESLPGKTIAGTSANLSGCASVSDPESLDKELLKKCDSVLLSASEKGIINSQGESTVVDLVNRKILRQAKYCFDLSLIS